jgi:hypothetical protein
LIEQLRSDRWWLLRNQVLGVLLEQRLLPPPPAVLVELPLVQH